MRLRGSETSVRSVVRKLSGATLGIGLAFVGVEVAQNPDKVADTYYHMTNKRTPTEETLTTALRRAFGEHVSVRCAPIAERVKHHSVAGTTATASVGRLWFIEGHDVRITEDICSAANTIVGRGLPFPADSKELKDATNAIRILAHEGQHVAQDEKDEPKVECYAVQTANEVAQHLGASIVVVRQLGEHLAVIDDELTTPAYKTPSTCYDGGPYDLRPDFPGNFPHLAPITVKMG